MATVHVLQTRELQFDGTASGISNRAGDRFGAAGGGELPELLARIYSFRVLGRQSLAGIWIGARRDYVTLDMLLSN